MTWVEVMDHGSKRRRLCEYVDYSPHEDAPHFSLDAFVAMMSQRVEAQTRWECDFIQYQPYAVWHLLHR